MYGLTLLSGPAEEPVSLAELKAWLRVEQSSDDALITALGASARRLVEKLLGAQLVTASWRLTLDGFPWPGGWDFLANPTFYPDPHTIRIPRAPLQSVDSITYYDFGDVQHTLADTVYVVDATKNPGLVALAQAQVWPVTRLKPNAVQVNFTAGFGDASAVPEGLTLAIKMQVAHWYEHRGEDGGQETLTPGVRALLAMEWNGESEYAF